MGGSFEVNEPKGEAEAGRCPFQAGIPLGAGQFLSLDWRGCWWLGTIATNPLTGAVAVSWRKVPAPGEAGATVLPPVGTPATPRDPILDLEVELDREDDGRVIASIEALPGCHVYGATEDEAIARVRELARDVLADQRAERQGLTSQPKNDTVDTEAILKSHRETAARFASYGGGQNASNDRKRARR